MNQKESHLDTGDFFQIDDIDNPEIALFGSRSLSHVIGVDFLPTILFLRKAYVKTNIILADDVFENAIDWANKTGNLVSRGIEQKDAPLSVVPVFDVVFFRDFFANSRSMKAHPNIPIAHAVNTADWIAELIESTRRRVDYLRRYPTDQKVEKEEVGHATEFVKRVPQLLTNSRNLSNSENIRAQNLLMIELFKTYWTFLNRKAELYKEYINIHRM